MALAWPGTSWVTPGHGGELWMGSQSYHWSNRSPELWNRQHLQPLKPLFLLPNMPEAFMYIKP